MRAIPFETIVNSLALTGSPTGKVRANVSNLRNRYDEPWRDHHNFEHPQELFSLLMDFKDFVRSPKVVGWAMLYHDAIYDPRAEHGRNEELSAQLSEAELASLLDPAEVSDVARYTRATAEHDDEGDDPDLDFFLDADLAILGAGEKRYDRYSSAIRTEYGHVPIDVYRVGRKSVLEGLSKRVQEIGLYKTQLFIDLFEEQARENIEREIAALSE